MYLWDSNNWQLHNAIPINKLIYMYLRDSITWNGWALQWPKGIKLRLNHTVVCHVYRDSIFKFCHCIIFVQLHYFLSRNNRGTKDIVSQLYKSWRDMSTLKLGPYIVHICGERLPLKNISLLRMKCQSRVIRDALKIHATLLDQYDCTTTRDNSSTAAFSLPGRYCCTWYVYIRGLQTFFSEGHISYSTTVRGPDILRNVIVSRYVAFHQINKIL